MIPCIFNLSHGRIQNLSMFEIGRAIGDDACWSPPAPPPPFFPRRESMKRLSFLPLRSRVDGLPKRVAQFHFARNRAGTPSPYSFNLILLYSRYLYSKLYSTALTAQFHHLKFAKGSVINQSINMEQRFPAFSHETTIFFFSFFFLVFFFNLASNYDKRKRESRENREIESMVLAYPTPAPQLVARHELEARQGGFIDSLANAVSSALDPNTSDNNGGGSTSDGTGTTTADDGSGTTNNGNGNGVSTSVSFYGGKSCIGTE